MLSIIISYNRDIVQIKNTVRSVTFPFVNMSFFYSSPELENGFVSLSWLSKDLTYSLLVNWDFQFDRRNNKKLGKKTHEPHQLTPGFSIMSQRTMSSFGNYVLSFYWPVQATVVCVAFDFVLLLIILCFCVCVSLQCMFLSSDSEKFGSGWNRLISP